MLHFMVTGYKLSFFFIFLKLEDQIFEERVEHYLCHETISPEVNMSDLLNGYEIESERFKRNNDAEEVLAGNGAYPDTERMVIV